MLRTILTILLWLFTLPALADVTFDNGTQDSVHTASSFSFNHTTGSGNNRLLTVLIAVNGTDVTSVTYNSVGLTLKTRSNSLGKHAEEWYLVNPATGSNSVAVVLGASQEVMARAVSFAGVDQSNPLGTSQVASNSSGTSTSVTISATSNGQCIDTLTLDQTTSAETANTGQVNTSILNTGSNLHTASSTEPGSTCATQGWSWTTSSLNVYIATPINAAAGRVGNPIIFQ